MNDQDRLARYRSEGYLLVEGLLDRATMERLRAAADALVARAARMTASDDVLDLAPDHRPEAPKVRRIKKPDAHDPAFAALARDPRIIAAIAPLIGPDIRLQGSKLNLKSPGHGEPVEWHQDWAFYPHTNDDLLAVGVPLDDCDLENGPLMVVPGTHRGPTFDHHADGRFVGAIDPARAGIDVGGAVPLLAKAGSVTIHHVRMVHGSAPNRSPRQRRLLLFEYVAADAWPLRGMECDFETFRAKTVAGRFTLEARVVPAPIRLPWPSPVGTIYEIQQGFTARQGSSFVEAAAE